MKVRSKNENIKATRVFTDREEPRAAFWKNYERCEAEMTNGGNIHVLTYYGIGGIGKSRLLKKLMSEMDERFTDKRYVYFDFNIQQESRAVLTALKNKLTEQCKFTFPLFELGSYMYAKKVGGNPDAPEIQQMTEKSPFLSLVLSIAGNIPMLGFATSMLSLADQCVAYVRTYLKNHSRELKQIEYMEAEELYRHLPYLFAQDLTHNQEHSGKLLVVLLDTYERLVNELSATGDPLMNDLWIRGEEGLIQNIPNVLWVIAGREKLKGERFDPDWAEALEQHILGNLSLADSDSFLSAAGVGGSELRQQLYELTNGTPVYLDLCVDQFARLSAKGILPEISMFGQNTHELIERFIRYMSDSQKDLVYTLACLQMWNDDLIMQIADAVLPNFSLSTYEKAKDFSFIIPSGDNWYNIHQTVGEVLVAHCPKLLKEKICQKIIDHFTKAIETQNVCGEDYPTSLTYIVRAGLMRYQDRSKLREFSIENIDKCLNNLIEAGRLIQVESLMEPLWEIAQSDQTDLFYALIASWMSRFFIKAGNELRSLELAEASVNLCQAFLGESHAETLAAKNDLAIALNSLAEHEKAREIEEYLVEAYQKIGGENNHNALTIMNNLGLTYRSLGQYEKALAVQTQVLQEFQRLHGENHPATVRAIGNLALTLEDMNQNEKALQMYEQTLTKFQELFGDNHLETIMAMQNIAGVLHKLNRQAEALSWNENILEKCRSALGSDHPQTIQAMRDFAFTLYQLQHYQDALSLEEEVFKKRRELLGDDHRKTLQSLRTIAIMHSSMANHEESAACWKALLKKHRALDGDDHPNTLEAIRNLVNNLQVLEHYEESLPLDQELLATHRVLFGENHPNTLRAMYNLADTLMHLAYYEDVLVLEQEILEKNRAMFSEDHPSILTIKNRISYALITLGRYDEALPLQKIVFSTLRRDLGIEDPRTARAAKRVIDTLRVLGREEEARELEAQLPKE